MTEEKVIITSDRTDCEETAVSDDKVGRDEEKAVIEEGKAVIEEEKAVIEEGKAEEVCTESEKNAENDDKRGKQAMSLDPDVFFAAYFKAVEKSDKLKKQLEELKNEASFSELLKKPENVEIAASDAVVEKKVIENYLKKIAKGRAVEVVGGNVGVTAVSENVAPRTLKEAKAMAETLFGR